MGLWSYCSGNLLEKLNLNINYQSWSSYLYFSGFMWVLISNSIKREKENGLGTWWVIGQDRNCTIIKPLIWWISFRIWVSHSVSQWVTATDVQKNSSLTKPFYRFHLNWDVLWLDSPIHAAFKILNPIMAKQTEKWETYLK